MTKRETNAQSGKLVEPPLSQQAFGRHTGYGYYFVRYRDGEVSRLMTKHHAQDYADIFGGTVHRHSQAPQRPHPAWGFSMWALLCVLLVVSLFFI